MKRAHNHKPSSAQIIEGICWAVIGLLIGIIAGPFVGTIFAMKFTETDYSNIESNIESIREELKDDPNYPYIGVQAIEKIVGPVDGENPFDGVSEQDLLKIVLDGTSYNTGSWEVKNISTHNKYDAINDLQLELSDLAPGIAAENFGTQVSPDKFTIDTMDENKVRSAIVSEYMTERIVKSKIKEIVPQGTSRYDVGKLVTLWLADYMEYYDEAAEQDANGMGSDEHWLYINADTGFIEHKGICVTYALMFNSIVHYVPINGETGLVDYDIDPHDAHYFTTRYISTKDHAYSAITYGDYDYWHFYDPTWYDSDKDDIWIDFPYIFTYCDILDGRHHFIVNAIALHK